MSKLFSSLFLGFLVTSASTSQAVDQTYVIRFPNGQTSLPKGPSGTVMKSCDGNCGEPGPSPARSPRPIEREERADRTKCERPIKVLALTDESFRRHGDERSVRATLEKAFSVYDEEFLTTFEIVAVQPLFTGVLKPMATDALMNLLQTRYPSRTLDGIGADIVVLFSWQSIFNVSKYGVEEAETKDGDITLGHATPFSRYVVANNDSDESRYVTVTHELGHLFGAVHVEDPTSYMAPFLDRLDELTFDANNRSIIETTRCDVDFRRGYKSLSAAKATQYSMLAAKTGTGKTDFVKNARRDEAQPAMDEGNRAMVSKQYDAAIIAFEKARQLDPANCWAALWLADAYRSSGDMDKATDLYGEAKEIGQIKAKEIGPTKSYCLDSVQQRLKNLETGKK